MLLVHPPAYQHTKQAELELVTQRCLCWWQVRRMLARANDCNNICFELLSIIALTCSLLALRSTFQYVATSRILGFRHSSESTQCTYALCITSYPWQLRRISAGSGISLSTLLVPQGESQVLTLARQRACLLEGNLRSALSLHECCVAVQASSSLQGSSRKQSVGLISPLPLTC